jgi:CheY-like chemotaxis protein
LLGNAFKFTCKGDGLTGRVNLHVASCALADGGTGIQLRVMDNGIGMSTEVLENLFQPFTQADDGIARKFGGTGLGLSICQRLVALLNGKISVVSQLGEGSVFTVELPLIPCEPAVLPAPTPGAQFVQSDCSTQADHANRLILLAEDNETNQEVIQEQLRILGYACEIADDGEAALRLWRSGRFALLLTDCNMPIMDGFELTEAIRRSERQGVRSPIIAVTANAMQGEAMRCLERGMDDYLCKPMRIDALAAMLTKWLAPMQTARADRRPDGHTTAS